MNSRGSWLAEPQVSEMVNLTASKWVSLQGSVTANLQGPAWVSNLANPLCSVQGNMQGDLMAI